MVVFKKVRGNSNEPLLVGLTTVYVRSNFVPVENEENVPEWEYDEVQYTKDEYIQLMASNVYSQANEITNAQIGLIETDENLSQTNEEVTNVQIALLDLDERLSALEGGE